MPDNVTELPPSPTRPDDPESPGNQAERERTADFDAENPQPPTGDGGENGNGGGRTIDEMADGADTGTEADGQEFFELEEKGQRVTLATLVKRGTKIEYEFKLGGKGIKGGANMGLLSYADPERTLIVPGRAGKTEVDPTYSPEGTIEKVMIRQHFKPTMAYDSRAEAARVAVFGE